MARDGFRYETLLRVRQRQEEVKVAALARVRREIAATERQRDEIIRQQRQMLEQAQETMRSEFQAPQVEGYFQYERFLARLAVDKDARLHELRRTEEQCRGEVEQAYKSRRIVEKLKEREHTVFLATVSKKEQAALDEVATNHAAGGRHGVAP